MRVNDFFQNGGSRGVVVRLYKAPRGRSNNRKIDGKRLPLQAASEGTWGNALKVRITTNVSPDVATRLD